MIDLASCFMLLLCKFFFSPIKAAETPGSALVLSRSILVPGVPCSSGPPGRCGANSHCVSGYCLCRQGFESRSGRQDDCIDINECSAISDCDSQYNVECTNYPGAYICDCKEGFTRDNSVWPRLKHCIDIDECSLKNPPRCWGPGHKCTNTVGSFICQCSNTLDKVNEFDYISTEVTRGFWECKPTCPSYPQITSTPFYSVETVDRHTREPVTMYILDILHSTRVSKSELQRVRSTCPMVNFQFQACFFNFSSSSEWPYPDLSFYLKYLRDQIEKYFIRHNDTFSNFTQTNCSEMENMQSDLSSGFCYRGYTQSYMLDLTSTDARTESVAVYLTKVMLPGVCFNFFVEFFRKTGYNEPKHSLCFFKPSQQLCSKESVTLEIEYSYGNKKNGVNRILMDSMVIQIHDSFYNFDSKFYDSFPKDDVVLSVIAANPKSKYRLSQLLSRSGIEECSTVNFGSFECCMTRFIQLRANDIQTEVLCTWDGLDIDMFLLRRSGHINCWRGTPTWRACCC
ncbi:uncharacterized protein LOC142342190 isoform X2 [Convolutriloba macropyga]|uniref:uncharacterized protein LOC142342190 isoform X2 n=1 Tax=Convolutriloba macropyga TaxID=536237 RepID=UPI003F5259F1